jgi:hypothetical protein
MSSTIEYQAVTAAHRRAERYSNEKAREAADAARAKVEAELDPDEYNPEKRALILDRADTAYESAWNMTHGAEWQPAYDKFLAEEYERLSPPRPSVAGLKEGESRTFGGELTPRSERRF